MKEKVLTGAIYAGTMIISTAVSLQLQFWISKKAAKKAIEEAAEEGIVSNEPEKADEEV